MIVVTECRIVTQDWYETETTKTGWDSHGWFFDDGMIMDDSWTVVEHLHFSKFGNPVKSIAEREVIL